MATKDDFDVTVGVKVYNASVSVPVYAVTPSVNVYAVTVPDLIAGAYTYIEDNAGNDVEDNDGNILIE